MRPRRQLRLLILSLSFTVSCAHQEPCGAGGKCAPAPPPETEAQAWARVEKALAEATARVRIACGNALVAEYDKPTWPSEAMRSSEYDVTKSLKELEATCDESRFIHRVIARYTKGGAPAELSSDGVLILHVDPADTKSDPYYLRRQFGWRWH